MGAEAAAAAGQTVSAAQAPCRVLAVDAASVCFFSIGVPVELSVIVEAPSEARVIPPVIITFLRPVTVSIVVLPVWVMFRVIPVPPVPGARIPKARPIVTIPAAGVSIIILARVIICIVITVTAPSTLGIIVSFRISLPGSELVGIVTCTGAGPLRLRIAVVLGISRC